MKKVEVEVTVAGVRWSAAVGFGAAREDGAPSVSISRAGVGVGAGWWGGQRIEDCGAAIGDDVYNAIDAAVAEELAKSSATTASVHDLATGEVRELPGDTRCVLAPAEIDLASGAAVQIGEVDGVPRLAYATSSGGRETLEAGAGPLLGRGPVSPQSPIRRRAPGVGERLLVETADRDADGSPLWRICQLVPKGFGAALVERLERLHRAGHAPSLEEAGEAAAAGRLWDVDAGADGCDRVLVADDERPALTRAAQDTEWIADALAHPEGSAAWASERGWTATRIGAVG